MMALVGTFTFVEYISTMDRLTHFDVINHNKILITSFSYLEFALCTYCSLRAKFESLKENGNEVNRAAPKVKVNRFVVSNEFFTFLSCLQIYSMNLTVLLFFSFLFIILMLCVPGMFLSLPLLTVILVCRCNCFLLLFALSPFAAMHH